MKLKEVVNSEYFLNEKYNLSFLDLYSTQGLKKLDKIFLEFLKNKNTKLFEEFINERLAKTKSGKELSLFIIEISKILEEFTIDLFNIEEKFFKVTNSLSRFDIVARIRVEYIQRVIAKKNDILLIEEVKNMNQHQAFELLRNLHIKSNDVDDIEIALANKIENSTNCELLEKYCFYALYNHKGIKFHENGGLFILPKKIDLNNLIDVKNIEYKEREGFNLTDKGYTSNRIKIEANYCIFCHNQHKDSCRKGFEVDENEYKKNDLFVELKGCPLDQKISEMNYLRNNSNIIASFLVALIDNPMIAGTGHRICNDCMKSCIYQKQEPVDIPQIETNILKDILKLPYGFEIYSLFVKWNPLKFQDYLPKEDSNKNVLIAGLGPAGYTLAHYLLNEGHNVVAIDGLKIEMLDEAITGGAHKKFMPIKNIDEIFENLEDRVIYGFGGVAEYGITSRYEKNFLTLIRIILERRENFRMFGGLRYGSSITEEAAFENFDHIALCIGAGKPKIIDFKNNFLKGVRMASDFLMALQLGGAYKKELFTNLQLRYPIIVVGGGLTAIDSACEANEYYFREIEKFAEKYKILKEAEELILGLNQEEKEICREFIEHFEYVKKFGRVEFYKKYGRTKIIYRKSLKDSPAYRLNHIEIIKAMEEGIEFIENSTPSEAIADEYNHIKFIKADKIYPCRSLIIAAGTSPNISIKTEDKLDYELDESKKFFKIIKNSDDKINFAIKNKDNKSVTIFGDLHPKFEGNVVKAMASAKLGYKKISEQLLKIKKSNNSKEEFFNKIARDFSSTIESIRSFGDNLFEIKIKSPLIVAQSEVGQIFRLQNYYKYAKKIKDQILKIEPLAITAVDIDKINHTLTAFVVNTGGSTNLLRYLKKNEKVILMGPSGNKTHIPNNKTVVLVGGGRGNMPLTKLAKLYKNNGCKVIFFAGYENGDYVINQEIMKENSDILIYAIKENYQNFDTNLYKGNVIDAIIDYVHQKNDNFIGLKHDFCNFKEIDFIFTIGNEKLMHRVFNITQNEIKYSLNKDYISFASLNAPMQCMLKGVCSQCIQRKFNKDKNEWEFFYACANQDQEMKYLDFEHLRNRCENNNLQEKITKYWIKYLEKIPNISD